MADQILVTYKVDTQQPEKALTDVQKELLATEQIGEKAFDGIGRAAGNSASGFGKAADSAHKMNTAIGGLRNSVNQVSRELPAFTMNLNTGFLAISNNLPILFDGLRNIREQNKLLAAEGKQTTSVLKALGEALFSWNTLLSVGVTLLTVYGGKIVELITGNKNLAEEKKKQIELQKTYNDKIQEEIELIEKQQQLMGKQVAAVQTFGRARSTGLNQRDRELKLIQANAEKEVAVMEEAAKKDWQILEFQLKNEKQINQERLENEKELLDKRIQIKEQEIAEINERLVVGTISFEEEVALQQKRADLYTEIQVMQINYDTEVARSGAELARKEEEILKQRLAMDQRLADFKERYFAEEWALYEKNLARQIEFAKIETAIGESKLDKKRKELAEMLALYEKAVDYELNRMMAIAGIATLEAKTDKEKIDAKIKTAEAEYQVKLESLQRIHATQEEFDLAEKERDHKISEAKKEYYQSEINALESFTDSVGSIMSAINRSTLIQSQNQLKALKRVDAQRRKDIEEDFQMGLISKEERDNKLNELEQAAAEREKAAQREMAQRERSMAIFLATLKTILLAIEAALNPTKIPQAVFAAAELAVLNSTPLPEFKEGVIDFKGKGTETSDSNIVKISSGESVIKAKSTKVFKDELKAINTSPLDYQKLIEQKYVIPAIEKERQNQASFAENIARSIALHNAFNDERIVKTLEKNKPATSKDIAILAATIEKNTRLEKFKSKLIRQR